MTTILASVIYQIPEFTEFNENSAPFRKNFIVHKMIVKGLGPSSSEFNSPLCELLPISRISSPAGFSFFVPSVRFHDHIYCNVLNNNIQPYPSEVITWRWEFALSIGLFPISN